MDEIDLDLSTGGDLETIERDLTDAGLLDEPAAQADPTSQDDADESVADTIERVYSEMEEAEGEQQQQAQAASDWNTELDGLVKEALERHGVSPEVAAEAKLDAPAMIRRLFNAEKVLQADPAAGFEWLATNYAARLSSEQKAQVAGAVMQALGYQAADQITAQERQRLQAFEQQDVAYQQAMEAAGQHASQSVQAFAQSGHAPHFDKVRPVMGALVQAGEARSIEEAYQMACRLKGLDVADAQAVAEKRKATIAKARKAQTPRTASRPVPDEDFSSMSLTEVLEKTYDEMVGRD